jgi:hypothetical protein
MAITPTHNVEYQIVPEDLCPQAVKVARRLQNLPDERFYVILLNKLTSNKWYWSILDRNGTELELIKD